MRALRRMAPLVLACAAAAAAAPPGSYDAGLARRLSLAAQNGRAFDYLRSLTAIGARLTGSTGYDRAVAWSIAEFEAVGATVRREPFTLPRTWARDRPAHGRIVAPVERQLRIAALGWTPSTPEGGIDAHVVVASARQPVDAANVRGRIVLVDADDHGEFERRLASAGALALLFPDADADEELAARMRRVGGEITPLPAAIVGHDDAAAIRTLARERPVRIQVDWRNRISDGPVQVDSIVAEIRGRERPDEWILVGAHLDSWDFATGAQDNAAGVAMVLEAARAIAALNRPARRSIRFALWGGEEQGLLGSTAYVGAHRDELDRAAAVLNTDGGTGRIFGWTTPGREDVQAEVRELGRALLQDLDAAAVDHSTVYAYDSDGGPFLREGVPVLDLNVDDRRYEEIHHKATDTIDRVDARNLAVGAATVAVTAYAIADAPGRLASRGPRRSR